MSRPHHDWHLKDWLRANGKRQADVVRDLDWNKARISLMVNGKQPYDRDSVNELAAYLNIRPYELLMHPEDAMAIRRLQAAAQEIVTLAHDAELAAEARDDDEPTIMEGIKLPPRKPWFVEPGKREPAKGKPRKSSAG